MSDNKDALAPQAANRKKRAAELYALVAADLVELREVAGITQTQLAHELGHSRSWLNKIEMGRTDISLADYLLLVGMLQGFASDHPAADLHKYLKSRSSRPKRRLTLVPKG